MEPLEFNPANYEWKHRESRSLYGVTISVFSGSLFVRSYLLHPAHIRSFVSFPPLFECKEMLTIVGWLWKCHLDHYQHFCLPRTHPLTNHRARYCGMAEVRLGVTSFSSPSLANKELLSDFVQSLFPPDIFTGFWDTTNLETKSKKCDKMLWSIQFVIVSFEFVGVLLFNCLLKLCLSRHLF